MIKKIERAHLFAGLLLFAAVFAAYSNVYNFAFLYDDEFFIEKNEFLKSWDMIGKIFSTSSTAGSGFKDAFYRPMQFSLYLVVRQVFGSEAWGFHLLNLAIHASNAFLFYLLARKMKFSAIVAIGMALLWAVHPIHVECVAYKSATADSLHTLFLLAGLHIMFPDGKLRHYVWGGVFFLLAILSKETAVLGAPLMTVCLFYFSRDRWNWKTYLKTLPFWTMSLGYALLRKTVLNFSGDFEFYKESNVYTENLLYRINTFFATLPKYLELLIWPHDLHIDRHFSVYADFAHILVLTGAAIVFVALFIVAKCVIHRGGKWLFPAFVVLWFASTHLLHSGVIMPLNSLFLEHWMYMPSMAFFMALGGLVTVVWNKKYVPQAAVTVTLVVSLVLGAYTFQQNRVWSNSITLFSHILKFNPKVARVRHGLAMAYSDLGENSKALALYEEALQEQPYPQTYHNMALLYLTQNNLEKGEEYLLKAISMDPQFFPSYSYLVQVYRVQKKMDKASEYEAKLQHLQQAR